jgi:preprotein translocase subunit SecE
MSVANFFKFARDVKAEAGRITWPRLKDTRTMTIMVFILASLIALFLMGVDFAIGSALKVLFGW